jgi:phospholipid/cholesterol/gamma-HCH transport system substrate-binding protein
MTKTTNNIKLGLFVTIGTALLIFALYLIGSKQHLFNDSVKLNAVFKNVDGLRNGNNIRFAGITIGTIEKIDIISDSLVVATLLVDKESIKFIRKTSIADIGSDGLMGNKLINILPGEPNSAVVAENDTIYSLAPVATDAMMRTLSNTNNNVLDITHDLKQITKRINESHALWDLLADSGAATKIRGSINNLDAMMKNANTVSSDVTAMLRDIRAGKGVAGKIIGDTTTAVELETLVVNLREASDTAKAALSHMHQFMKDLNITPGPLGVLARDTAMANDMRSMIHNMNTSTATLDENMKALQSNFLFRKYFKKQAKKKAAGK